MHAVGTRRSNQSALDADFTGGLADANVSLPELAASLDLTSDSAEAEEKPVTINALPSPPHRSRQAALTWVKSPTPLEDMVVIVGLGEVSSWGSGRTRTLAEYGIQRDGDV